MVIKLIKKEESFVNKEGKPTTCYGLYVVVNGIEVKVQPVFKNYRSLLLVCAEKVND